MTKEEKIKEAWGTLSNKVDENGWLYFGHSCNGWGDVEYWLKQNNVNSEEKHYDATYYECDNGDLLNIRIRPKSLKGIDNNNGWVKIESEDDLPKDEEGLYHLTHIDKDAFLPSEPYYILEKFWRTGTITHYQPIEKPKPPIY